MALATTLKATLPKPPISLFRLRKRFGNLSCISRHRLSQCLTGKCLGTYSAVDRWCGKTSARVTKRHYVQSSAAQSAQQTQNVSGTQLRFRADRYLCLHDPVGYTVMCLQLMQDLDYMAEALQQAQIAAEQQEVPVGAVMVCGGQVISKAHNQVEQTGNPTAHAEMLCIQQSAGILGRWRLLESTLYVTLEPCPMCAGALLQSRVGTVVYGARNTLLGDLN